MCHQNTSKGSDCINRDSVYSPDPAYFKEPANAESNNWNEWQVHHSVQGLAYSSDGCIIKAYIVILLVYPAIALSYTVYAFCKRQGSSPWRSVSELTTLALNSPQPPKDLEAFESTSAGIYGLGVFEKNVRVAAVDDEKGVEEGVEELQLVFGKEMPAGFKKLTPNQEYGSIH